MLVLNLPFKALMFLTLMRPSLVLFLVLWLKLVKDLLKVRCRLALLPFLISCLIWLDLDRKSGSAGMPRPISYAVFCLKKKKRKSQSRRSLPFLSLNTAPTHALLFTSSPSLDTYTLSLHDALPILMFLTLMRPSLVLFLVLWLKLVKDFLKVRCRLALLPFLISCLIWLDLVASLPLIKERILVIILLLHFLSLMLGSVLVLMLP